MLKERTWLEILAEKETETDDCETLGGHLPHKTLGAI